MKNELTNKHLDYYIDIGRIYRLYHVVGRNAQTKQIVLEVPLFASGRVSIVCEYSWLELSVSGVLVCLRLSFSLKRRSVMQDEVGHVIKQHVEDSTF